MRETLSEFVVRNVNMEVYSNVLSNELKMNIIIKS